MPQYMIFYGRMGAASIVWEPYENPIGVYEADTAEEACQKASMHRSIMGGFFAVEGRFWGTTPGDLPRQFGTKQSAEERLIALTESIEKVSKQLGRGGDGN